MEDAYYLQLRIIKQVTPYTVFKILYQDKTDYKLMGHVMKRKLMKLNGYQISVLKKLPMKKVLKLFLMHLVIRKLNIGGGM